MPIAWWGPKLELDGPGGTTPKTWISLKAVDMIAYLAQSTQAPYNEPYLMLATRLGYMTPSGDTSSSTAVLVTNGGHVFGRLGQGADTMPGSNAPFLWADQSSTYVAGMLISFFPEGESDVGLAAGKVVNMTVQAADYLDLTSLNVPSMPSAALNPDSSGASELSKSALTVSLLMMAQIMML